ncbi:Protein arginine N-methyltransferase [Artemisia annua]|uniref:Protein arginine N-methyltransferase n=1 Tax=Artemisia annua TaxID=35608 RepID=A0A2U1L4H1_ARTAN|nr:Protein arginine N-methyltransferase [Artemisia annua]
MHMVFFRLLKLVVVFISLGSGSWDQLLGEGNSPAFTIRSVAAIAIPLSRFPIFFSLRSPVYVKAGSPIDFHIWRCCGNTKVCYEWMESQLTVCIDAKPSDTGKGKKQIVEAVYEFQHLGQRGRLRGTNAESRNVPVSWGSNNRYGRLATRGKTTRNKCMEADIPDFKIRLYNVIGTREYELPTADIKSMDFHLFEFLLATGPPDGVA